ncbi:MAG: Gfo/Idh/MocA family oxidoreductase [Ignavibacteriota bacterium]
MSEQGFSRRYFFFGTLLAGAIPRGGFGSVPTLPALGHKPFSEKLNVAAIGCGGQGGVDLIAASHTENIVALCDVDENRAAANYALFEKAPKYKDFRVMLDKEGKNIDAVTIGVPDFMHATVALACMERGKHVYLEKPLTTTPWEARLLHDAALKYKVATQMGNQGFSHESIRVAAEMIWSGAIGDVTEVHISTSPGTHPTGLQAPPPTSPVPRGVDWDLWQGRSEPRPFSDRYVPYNWRGFLDYGTGQIGNWATHCASPVQFALQLTAPTSVECVSQEGKSSISFPDRGVIRLEFPARENMPPVTVYYHDSARPDTSDAYHVPGMENENILPPGKQPHRQGSADGSGSRRWQRTWRSTSHTSRATRHSRGAHRTGRSGRRGVRRASPPQATRHPLRKWSRLHRHEGYYGDLRSRRRRPSVARCEVGGIRVAAAIANTFSRAHGRLGARLQRRRGVVCRFPDRRTVRGVADARCDRLARAR